MTNSAVSIVKEPDPKQCIQKNFELLGGIEKYIHTGEKVLLKPNLVVPLKTETGVTTNPAVIQELIDLCYMADSQKVYVGDSPFFPFKARKCFEVTGMKEAVLDAGAELLYFDEGPYTELESDEAVILKKIRVPQKLTEIDAIITVPRLKTHNQTFVSLSLKNQHGLVPPEDKKLCHKDDLHQKLIDINHILKNKLRVGLIDGTYALEGQGPTLGSPRQMNICLAGTDLVALDAVATTLMGFSPSNITHLRLASLQGLGVLNVKNVKILGTPIDSVSQHFMKPSNEIIGIAPNVHVYAGGACRPGCFAWTRVGLDRLIKRNELDKYGDITIIIGKNPTVPRNLQGHVFVIGNCAEDYKDKGHFFKGCPAFDVWDLRKILKETP
ncbi:MAG: DUF362 domain-containing protein [Candidatus Helarchaeota archaeon]